MKFTISKKDVIAIIIKCDKMKDNYVHITLNSSTSYSFDQYNETKVRENYMKNVKLIMF